MIDVAVIHPVETMWLHLGTNTGTRATRQELDARFDALVTGLLLRQVDFDLISESMLPGLDPRCDAAGLHVGRMTYRTVIVPDMQTIRATTLDVLERFRAQGGRILFAWAPHRLELGRLEPGAHVLEIDAFVGRHNGFGALHNANDAFRWYGPDAWRTEGGEWTDDFGCCPRGCCRAWNYGYRSEFYEWICTLPGDAHRIGAADQARGLGHRYPETGHARGADR